MNDWAGGLWDWVLPPQNPQSYNKDITEGYSLLRTNRVDKICSNFSEEEERQAAPHIGYYLRRLSPRYGKNPFRAWQALIASYKLGVPVPPWAARIFEELWNDWLYVPVTDLNYAFGFKAKKSGQVSAFQKAELKERDLRLIWEVYYLKNLGYGVKKACAMVVTAFYKEEEDWCERRYNLKPRNWESMPDTLYKKFYTWYRTSGKKWDGSPRATFLTNNPIEKEKFLKRYNANK